MALVLEQGGEVKITGEVMKANTGWGAEIIALFLRRGIGVEVTEEVSKMAAMNEL
jgi:hypothetical protein